LIDAHVHVWQLGRNGCTWPPSELAPIHRDYNLADVERATAGTGVEHVILVQSQDREEDTNWLLREAATSPLVAGVVGWFDHDMHDVHDRIDQARRCGKLVGLRVMAQDRQPDYLTTPELDTMLQAVQAAGLSLDLLVRRQHLDAAVTLAGRFPSLRMVIDHAAKPDIRHDRIDDWRDAIKAAAAQPNLFCKLSGLVTEAPPSQPVETLAPYIEALLDTFGPTRLIWGSDWPVLQLNGAYREWLAFARAAIPEQHLAAVFGDNARVFYRLNQ
jgi:L-fuconolactonase